MSKDSTLVQLVGTGATTYSSGGTSLWSFEQLRPISGKPGMVTYLTGLHVHLDGGLTKAAGGAGSVGEYKLYDLLKQILFRAKGRKNPYDLSTGSKARIFQQAVTGKRPQSSADLTLTGGGATDTFNRWLLLPFRFPGAENPTDFEIPISLIRDAELSLGWCVSGTEFGADPTVAATTYVRVYAELIERPVFKSPVEFSVRDVTLAALDSHVEISGEVVHAILESQTIAAGTAENPLTSAERVQVTQLSFGSFRALDSIPVEVLVKRWNEEHAADENARLPEFTADTADWVPLYFPRRRPYGMTDLPVSQGRARIVLTGTVTTPCLILFTSELLDDSRLYDDVTKAGVPVHPDFRRSTAAYFFSPDTPSGIPLIAGGDDGAHRVARVLLSQPRKAIPPELLAG